ncbi:hypothetical protein COT50_01010, partial [candidate division WWE3 bacterium CG08_land_8_20_14_0_20_41_10]
GNEYFRLVELGGLAELSRIGESPEYWTPNGLSNLTRLIMEATTGIRFLHESTLYNRESDINEDIAFFNLSNNPKWDSLDATTQYLFLKGLGRMHDDKYKTFQEFTSDLRAYYTIMTTGKFPKTSDGTDYQGSSSQAKAALMVAKNQNDSASESALKASLRRRYYHEASKTEDQVREEKAQNSLRTAESMIKFIDKPGCGSAPKLVLLEEYLIHLSCNKEQNRPEYWDTASLAVGFLGKILIGLPDTTNASVKEALYNWCGSMVQIIPNDSISKYSRHQRSTILLEEEKLPELDQLISIYLASHQQGDTPSQETIETVVGIKTEQLLAQMKARVAQLEADKAALAKQNAELAVQLAEKVTPAKKNEKVIGVAELTLAERLERTEQFHAKVAEVLGISAREINAEVFKILRINPDIDPQEAIGLARTNALVKRGLDVVVPGKPSYPAETFARFAGAVGLWGLKAGNRGEYNKAVATLKQAGINVVDNNWLDPGDDRWY